MTPQDAISTLKKGGEPPELAEAIDILASEPTTSLESIKLGLKYKGSVAEQAALALYKRTFRPIPEDRSLLVTDPDEWTQMIRSGHASPETFVELAKINEQSIEKRKTVEWKVAFGFWLGIGVFTWFMTQREPAIGDSAQLWLGFLFLGMLAVWVFCWQFPIHRAYIEDKNWKHYYKDRAEGVDSKRPRKVRYQEPAKNPWLWGQVLMTALFLVLAYLVVFHTTPRGLEQNPGVDRLTGENLRTVIEKLPSAAQQ